MSATSRQNKKTFVASTVHLPKFPSGSGFNVHRDSISFLFGQKPAPDFAYSAVQLLSILKVVPTAVFSQMKFPVGDVHSMSKFVSPDPKSVTLLSNVFQEDFVGCLEFAPTPEKNFLEQPIPALFDPGQPDLLQAILDCMRMQISLLSDMRDTLDSEIRLIKGSICAPLSMDQSHDKLPSLCSDVICEQAEVQTTAPDRDLVNVSVDFCV